MAHTVAPTRATKPNRRADARTQITAATYEGQVRQLARLCLEDRDPGRTCSMARALAPSYPFLGELATAMQAELAAAR